MSGGKREREREENTFYDVLLRIILQPPDERKVLHAESNDGGNDAERYSVTSLIRYFQGLIARS